MLPDVLLCLEFNTPLFKAVQGMLHNSRYTCYTWDVMSVLYNADVSIGIIFSTSMGPKSFLKCIFVI